MILTCSMLIVTPRIGEEEFQRVLDQVESDSTGLQIGYRGGSSSSSCSTSIS